MSASMVGLSVRHADSGVPRGAFRLSINDPEAFALSDHPPRFAAFGLAEA